MARLEELTSTLESGDLKLEEALACLQEGNELLQHCRKLLNAAEETLKVLELEQPKTISTADEEEKP